MIKINSHSKRSRVITCIKETTFKIYILWGRGVKGANTARLYVFVKYAKCLQSLFQQDKMNVSFREMARLITRNSLTSGQHGMDTQIEFQGKMGLGLVQGKGLDCYFVFCCFVFFKFNFFEKLFQE